MKLKSKPQTINLGDLVLDRDNPRFAELYSGSDKEEELIDYLLFNESAEDIAQAISKAQEFYPDRPLWVLEKDGYYLVKDGNRRCAAVKALQHPSKYGIAHIKKLEFSSLPVLVYHNESDLEARIREEHTSTLFRQWGRIAKAIEVHRLFSSGSSLTSMTDLDSSPKDLLKLASFYYEAAKIGKEDFKKLLRSGRGKSGGKATIFERLFRFRSDCGYTFKSRSTFELEVKNMDLFESYVKAMVNFLTDNPHIGARDFDKNPEGFLHKLKPYNFPPEKEVDEDDISAKTSQTDQSGDGESLKDVGTGKQKESKEGSSTDITPQKPTEKRKSIKHRPSYTRKKIPSALERLIKECYDLDQNNFANAKTALSRVVFECTLKYVIENTKLANGKYLTDKDYFRLAFYDRRGNRLTYTNFETLKSKFTELIKDTGIRKAFANFDLQRSHQIIHNYRVGAVPADAKSLCDNLIDLLEFMLQEETDLINSLDHSKL